MFELKHHPATSGSSDGPADNSHSRDADSRDAKPGDGGGREGAGPRLHCLRGLSGPEELRDDIRALLALPQPIQRAFWTVLAPYLAGDDSEAAQKPIFALCEEHKTDPQSLVGPVRGARFLVSNAARAALDKERFVADLSQLADAASLPAAIDILLPCFERALPVFRQEIIARTISDHGRLVRDVNWRVDKIIHSEHGDGVNVPVAVMTFRYQEGAKEERITLHLLPEQIAKVRAACLDLLPPAAASERVSTNRDAPSRSDVKGSSS